MRDLECREAVAMLTDYLDGALDAETTSSIEQHLTGCDGCTTFLEQLRTTSDALGELRDDDLPPALRDGLLSEFRKKPSDDV